MFADNGGAKLAKQKPEPQVVSALKHKTDRGSVSDKYKPNWESLDSRPLPQWYDEAKVGKFN